MSKVLELFGLPTSDSSVDWKEVVEKQDCPYLGKRCTKVRKSEPEISIGTCSVLYGKRKEPILICPFRFLERRQVFTDCLHLLTTHEPGNELHVVPEVSVPGGSVDYFLVSAKGSKARDFVGIELQTLDTTGTVWPARQRFLKEAGVVREPQASYKTYGMNWKMTAKTTLIQLHHKVQTFEAVNKKLVLVLQDHLFSYLQDQFQFDHLSDARDGDPMHFHAYRFVSQDSGVYRVDLAERKSTDTAGIAVCLGLQADANVGLRDITAQIEAKMSDETRFEI